MNFWWEKIKKEEADIPSDYWVVWCTYILAAVVAPGNAMAYYYTSIWAVAQHLSFLPPLCGVIVQQVKAIYTQAYIYICNISKRLLNRLMNKQDLLLVYRPIHWWSDSFLSALWGFICTLYGAIVRPPCICDGGKKRGQTNHLTVLVGLMPPQTLQQTPFTLPTRKCIYFSFFFLNFG